MPFKLHVTLWQRRDDAPGEDEFPGLPWRATAICPFTGSPVVAAGSTVAIAKDMLGKAIQKLALAYCAEPPSTTTWSVGWDG